MTRKINKSKGSERIEYKFSNGKTAFQEELSFEDYAKIMRLFEKEIFDSLEDVSPKKLEKLSIDLGFEKIAQVLAISLKQDYKVEDVKQLKQSEASKCINDFFYLHPSLMNDLTDLSKNVASQMMTTEYRNFTNTLEDLLRKASAQPSSSLSTQSAGETSPNTKKQKD